MEITIEPTLQEFLITHDALNKFIINIEKNRNGIYHAYTINTAFSWLNSNERYSYWNNLSCLFEILDFKNIKQCEKSKLKGFKPNDKVKCVMPDDNIGLINEETYIIKSIHDDNFVYIKDISPLWPLSEMRFELVEDINPSIETYGINF